MFEVREATAESLFKAQKEKARGQLRLDISSRCFPRDLQEPIDLQAARGAIGERVVEIAYSAAAEAASLGADRKEFEPDAVPPPLGADVLLRLMPSSDSFEPFVERRLNELLGLDRLKQNYRQALTLLARDFYGWCQTDDAGCDFVVKTQHGTVAIQCKLEPSRLSALPAADRIWTPVVDD
jgi:hypothetical protein